MDSFSNIPEHQKAEFLRHLEEQQVKDSLRMYNNLVESCFSKCVMVGWDGVSTCISSSTVTNSIYNLTFTSAIEFQF